jgi:hypothetical protein
MVGDGIKLIGWLRVSISFCEEAGNSAASFYVNDTIV